MLQQVITSIVGVSLVGGSVYSWRVWKVDGALAVFFIVVGFEILLNVR